MTPVTEAASKPVMCVPSDTWIVVSVWDRNAVSPASVSRTSRLPPERIAVTPVGKLPTGVTVMETTAGLLTRPVVASVAVNWKLSLPMKFAIGT